MKKDKNENTQFLTLDKHYKNIWKLSGIDLHYSLEQSA